MIDFSADLSQLDLLAARLAVAAALSDRIVERAVDTTAEKVLAEQQATVPVLTGELQQSLGIERIDGNIARIGSISGPAADRAHYVEYGTAHMAPQPFIRPAGEKFKPAFVKAIAAGPFLKR